MGFFKRLLGICQTREPSDAGCWMFVKSEISVDLARTPELSLKGSSIRLEGRSLPTRVLVVHGHDGEFYAFVNKCTHAGRRLDPLADPGKIQCCSIGKSTFDYTGKKLSGTAKGDLKSLTTETKDNKVIIKSS
ncbi:MAG: Rieske 2Fe-2S domain-containing protein [Deltaproteobacteria bacterium]|nr:Rieske 2Fe-2S domain-containing protein [Deltaproteobacteria bacterium]MBW1871424.1 Rieske 2Fe-2S domain-containing protein [Deltaproteobacteria bacterium]